MVFHWCILGSQLSPKQLSPTLSIKSYQKLGPGTFCTTLMLDSIEANIRLILHYMNKSEGQSDLQRVYDTYPSEKTLVYF